MSLAESYHAAHKARLARLGAPSPYQAPVVAPPAPALVYPRFNVQTLYYNQMWFFDLITERSPLRAEPPKIEEIQRAISIYFKVSKNDLLSARRTMGIVRPRQIGYYLSKKLTLKSLPEIGRRFGGRDHTSIISGIRKIEALRKTDTRIDGDVRALAAALGGVLA